MRRHAVAILCLALFALITVGYQPPQVGIAWEEDPAFFAEAFYLYHSTNISLPFSQWTRIAKFDGTARAGFVDKPPGPEDFYFMTCSNCVGESYPFDR